MLDHLILARLQFAFTVSCHIIFPALNIGLASWLVLLEGFWLRTGNQIYKDLYNMWVKVFALAFAMGVVSGVVMSYQFGNNWSALIDKVGNVIGPLMGYEVLTAFFLEASFLGVMLFGEGRVTKKMHFTSTIIVAVGTIISAFWILSVNSWMQTPAGFEIDVNSAFHPVDWMKIIFNPSFIIRFWHMLLASYLTATFVIIGASCFYMIKGHSPAHSKFMLKTAIFIATALSVTQILVGDSHGLKVKKHQPAKLAAIESIWESKHGQELVLFAIPNEKEERNDYEISIPKLGSILLSHSINGYVRGLKEWACDKRPPVLPVFFAFRVMAGIGFLMVAFSISGCILYKRKRLYSSKLFHIIGVCMSPSGFIALLAGWYVTEIGRQPWVVYNILLVKDALSTAVNTEYVAVTLLLFVVTYLALFGTGIYYIFSIIRKGIKSE